MSMKLQKLGIGLCGLASLGSFPLQHLYATRKMEYLAIDVGYSIADCDWVPHSQVALDSQHSDHQGGVEWSIASWEELV